MGSPWTRRRGKLGCTVRTVWRDLDVLQKANADGFRAKLLLGAADYLPQIQEALLERRTLDLDYFAFSKQEETTRFVDPYHLTYHQGGLYLIGHCHARKDLRIFAVERIRRLKLTTRRFTLPANFNAERYLESAWGMMRGQQVTIKVALSRSGGQDGRKPLKTDAATWP